MALPVVQYTDFSRNDNDAIQQYFQMGLSYTTILQFLSRFHGIVLSLRTLKRRLKILGLFRVGLSSPAAISHALSSELNGPGSSWGYRRMSYCLRHKYHLTVSREIIRKYLRYHDPAAVDARLRQRLRRRTYTSNGPNDSWHVDGYDKLTRYGFAISGCVDGFSRKIIWLRCCYTNNNPNVIASYYLDAVEKLMVCPHLLRSDRGTENTTMAALQHCLTGNTGSHAFGKSTANQRIEMLWAVLRRQLSQWFIDLFEGMSSYGLFDTSVDRDIECCRYCFMRLLQSHLDNFKVYWNSHRIRPSAGAVCPAGIPDELYFMPSHDYVDCSVVVDPPIIGHYRTFVQQPRTCSSEDVESYFDYLRLFYRWQLPVRWEEAVMLYVDLRNELIRTGY